MVPEGTAWAGRLAARADRPPWLPPGAVAYCHQGAAGCHPGSLSAATRGSLHAVTALSPQEQRREADQQVDDHVGFHAPDTSSRCPGTPDVGCRLTAAIEHRLESTGPAAARESSETPMTTPAKSQKRTSFAMPDSVQKIFIGFPSLSSTSMGRRKEERQMLPAAPSHGKRETAGRREPGGITWSAVRYRCRAGKCQPPAPSPTRVTASSSTAYALPACGTCPPVTSRTASSNGSQDIARSTSPPPGSGGPWVSPVARKMWSTWLLRLSAPWTRPIGVHSAARSPVSSASSRRAAASGSASQWSMPPPGSRHWVLPWV